EAVPADEVAVLLIRQCLEWSRVERLAALLQGQRDGVLGHDGLARAGGGGDEDRCAFIEGRHGFELEGVGLEGQRRQEVSACHVWSFLEESSNQNRQL